MAATRTKLASIFLLAPALVVAGTTTNWIPLGGLTNGLLSYDSSTLRVIGPGISEFWTLSTFSKAQTLTLEGKKVPYVSMKAQYLLDCGQRQITQKYSIYYNAALEAIYSAPGYMPTPIIPETLGDSLRASFCQ